MTMWVLNYNYNLIFIALISFLNQVGLFTIIKLFTYILLVLYSII